MTVRKNFTFSDETARNLEALAKKRGQKQSQLVAELIQKELHEQEKQKRLAMIDKLSGMFTGHFPDGVTIQSIKADRNDI